MASLDQTESWGPQHRVLPGPVAPGFFFIETPLGFGLYWMLRAGYCGLGAVVGLPGLDFPSLLELQQSLGREQQNHLRHVYYLSLEAMRRNRLESKLISSGHSSNIYFGSVISVARRGAAHTKVVEEIEVSFLNFYSRNLVAAPKINPRP